jgi:antitoxin ParD1/3/4
MTTLNVSMPEAMREYIEVQASSGNYSASEYVRHLIREDQQRKQMREREILHQLLAISAKELDEGKYGTFSVKEFLRAGRERRRKAKH